MSKAPIVLAFVALTALPTVGLAQSPAALANNDTARELQRLGLHYTGRMGAARRYSSQISYQEAWAAEMRARKAAKQAAREAEAEKGVAAKIDG